MSQLDFTRNMKRAIGMCDEYAYKYVYVSTCMYIYHAKPLSNPYTAKPEIMHQHQISIAQMVNVYILTSTEAKSTRETKQMIGVCVSSVYLVILEKHLRSKERESEKRIIHTFELL